MQCSTVKETCLPHLSSSSPALPPFFSIHFFWLFLVFSLSSQKHLPFLPKSNTPTIFPHPLSFSPCPFLSLLGQSSDRHCITVVLLCLGAGESGLAFTLSSIAARVSSKAAIQPAQSLPTGNRPTEEKGAARLLCSALSEAACLHHLL